MTNCAGEEVRGETSLGASLVKIGSEEEVRGVTGPETTFIVSSVEGCTSRLNIFFSRFKGMMVLDETFSQTEI